MAEVELKCQDDTQFVFCEGSLELLNQISGYIEDEFLAQLRDF